MPDENVLVIPEPALEFRYAQRLTYPRDGLAMLVPMTRMTFSPGEHIIRRRRN